MTGEHPRPAPDPDAAPFWAAAREQRLMLQRCASCGEWRFPPRPVCAACHSVEATWEQASGDGVVHSCTVCHRPVLPAFAERTPYNVVVVQLAEGPFLISNLVDAEPEVGQRVTVRFVAIDDELTLPQFVRS